MSSFEISHRSSTTSVEEVICRLRHDFSDTWSLHGRIVRLLNEPLWQRTFAAKLHINTGE